MVYFVGAGPGAADLITVRGKKLLEGADLIVYAGSLVNPELLDFARPGCVKKNSADMTLEQVIEAMVPFARQGKTVVRLHTGDPSVFGAIREQMDALKSRGVPFQVVPGVSSFCGAAATLGAEYTLPGVSQTVILTRLAGRNLQVHRLPAQHQYLLVVPADEHFITGEIAGRHRNHRSAPASGIPALDQRGLLGGLDVLVRGEVVRHEGDLVLVKDRLLAELGKLIDGYRRSDVVSEHHIQVGHDQLAGTHALKACMCCQDFL